MSNFIQEKTYESYLAGVGRFRWFIVINILMSLSLFSHLYLEHGMQESQLLKIEKRSVEGNKNIKVKKLFDLTQEIKSAQDLSNIPEKINEAANLQLTIDRGDYLLKHELFARRTIPILNIEVPANDFLLLILAMICTLSSMVWLTLISIEAQIVKLQTLFDDRHSINGLIKINFMFTVTRGNKYTHVIQSLALWLPFIIGIICVCLDLIPMFVEICGNSSADGFGGWMAVIFRTFSSIIIIFAIFGLTIGSQFKINQIDKSLD